MATIGTTTGTIQIPWESGSGSIYIGYEGDLSEDKAITISSDVNDLSTARSQTITFSYGGNTKTLKVTQAAAVTVGNVYYAKNSDLTDSVVTIMSSSSYQFTFDGIEGDWADLNDPYPLGTIRNGILNGSGSLYVLFQSSDLEKPSALEYSIFKVKDGVSTEVYSGSCAYQGRATMATLASLKTILQSGYDIHIRLAD